MRIFPMVFLFLFSFGWTQAQQATIFSRAKIHLDHFSPNQLGALGFDLTHGHWHGKAYESDFSQTELAKVKAAGFRYEVLIEDVQAYYVAQNEGLSGEIDRSRAYTRSTDCFRDETYQVPEHFRLGSMGGFFTYEEMLEHLDSMRILYPHLITSRQVAGNNTTIEGRDVYWWRISDNPEQEEDEPEVFYNSVTHAREPGGMSQMIFFMWYVLENYDRDPDIRFIVDEAQLYFMPCVNPDGYIYNQTNFPNGGGLWRKNKRDNDGNNIFEEHMDGVDLNRNFAYQWGFSDSGSSPVFSSAVYRGTEAFSEPETRIIRDFCEAHEFRVALNYHTHGELLLYPFSYIDTLADPVFKVAGDLLTLENHYHAGTPVETVGYAVNGDVNDWMYGEEMTKPRVYAFTPEVGDGGFWPAMDQIVPHCVDNIWQNLTAARLAMELTILDIRAFDWQLSGGLPYRLEHFGFDDATITLEAESLSGNIDFVPTRQFIPVKTAEVKFGAMDYELDVNIKHGDTIVVRLSWTAGGVTWVDTIVQPYYEETPSWSDPGQTLQNWNLISIGNTFQHWGITSQEYFSPPSCITDSPLSPYAPNVRSVMTSIEAIDIPTIAERIELVFYAKWELEADRDYVQVLLAPEGSSTFEPLCGLYTNAGVAAQSQAVGEPLYDGIKDYWIREQIDLSDYAGERVQLRFLIQSDGNEDGSQGFFLDDLALRVIEEDGTTSLISLEEPKNGLLSVQPNPVQEELTLLYDLGGKAGQLEIYDIMGRQMLAKTLKPGSTTQLIPTSAWESGLYSIRLRRANGSTGELKLIKE